MIFARSVSLYIEKFRRQPRLGSVHAQNPHAHAVNRTDPHSLRVHDARDAFLHLVRRLVRERDRENRFGRDSLFRYQIGDAGSQHPRLAASRARQHQNGSLRRQHRLYLFFVQIVEYIAYFRRLIHKIIITYRLPFGKRIRGFEVFSRPSFTLSLREARTRFPCGKRSKARRYFSLKESV